MGKAGKFVFNNKIPTSPQFHESDLCHTLILSGLTATEIQCPSGLLVRKSYSA